MRSLKFVVNEVLLKPPLLFPSGIVGIVVGIVIGLTLLTLPSPAQETLSSNDLPVIQAVLKGDRAELEDLLSSGSDPNEADAEGRTALHYAVIKRSLRNSYGLVKVLLKHGADPSKKDNLSATPLVAAISMNGSEAVVEALVKAGSDPNQTLVNGLSLLTMAKMMGNEGAVAAISEAGGVHGSSPQELSMMKDLPRMGSFVRELWDKMDRGDLNDSREVWNAKVLAIFKRIYGFEDGHPELERFKNELAKEFGLERCSGCETQ